MKCPKCQFDNPEDKNFCGRCGTKLESICPRCQSPNPPDFHFCGDCGHQLEAEPSLKAQPPSTPDSERKHVTVLFSDMSGYTSMAEKMDPEEVKEFMGKIFGEISKVVAKYGGFIEKFIGDAVMALFGVPTAHEDDPVRAIKASREIHDIVYSLSFQYEKRIGKALCMHTGICTGLVVTGEVNLEKGTHGVLGDTINTAARLSGLANPGEVIISPDTHHRAEGYFNFEALQPTTIKGKAEPIRPYKVLSAREDPTTTHRLSGLRAELIGRKVEMALLQEAITNLKQGKGSIFSIVGDAGTGKSRLIEEFKASLNLDEVRWREGHAYAYSQNIPYFPLIDLLSRAWQIQEGDTPEQVRKKVETGAGDLISERSGLIPYIGSLYSLKYLEIENVGPEYWKLKLHEAVQMILAALTRRSPTIICIEDLHWADPSSVELLRNILSDFRYPAIFLCIFRPAFGLFASHQMSTMESYQEIRLDDLSPSEAQSMVESLLKTDAAPGELKKFIRDRVEGNPFYLEEVINSLLETAILIREDGQWTLTKPLIDANIPSTIQGVISARLDGLSRDMKRVIHEASVIGRAFLYKILKRVTELKDVIDKSLSGLERLELIRTRTIQPDLEYIFKHALTQEVVYNRLLKKERQNIHEKIGQVMEEMFHDRIAELYETLAYHFKKGHSTLKAVDYLKKAAEKSFRRYALDEAHQYYSEAFELLAKQADQSEEQKSLQVDILLQWAVIFYRRCCFIELIDLLKKNEDLVISLNDKEKTGMFYARLGGAVNWTNEFTEAHVYLSRALAIGEETKNENVIGYACVFLPWCCADLGLLDEAVAFCKKAQALGLYKSDPDVFRHVSFYLGYASYFRGDVTKAREIGNSIIEYAGNHSRLECLSDGYLCLTFADLVSGDLSSAIEYAQKSYQCALDPLIKITATTILGMTYVAAGQYEEAQNILEELTRMTRTYHSTTHGTVAKLYTGIIMVINGNLNQGISQIEEVAQEYQRNKLRYRYAVCNHLLGQVYALVMQGGGKVSFSLLVKNICFLIKTAPFAYVKAETHFNKAIEVTKEIGAKGLRGQVYFDLGGLYKNHGKREKAKECILNAIEAFEECEAHVFLQRAREVLSTMR